MSKSKRHPRNGPSPYYGRPNKQLGHKSQGRKHGEMARRAQDSNRHKDCKTKNFLEGELERAAQRNAGSLFRL